MATFSRAKAVGFLIALGSSLVLASATYPKLAPLATGIALLLRSPLAAWFVGDPVAAPQAAPEPQEKP